MWERKKTIFSFLEHFNLKTRIFLDCVGKIRFYSCELLKMHIFHSFLEKMHLHALALNSASLCVCVCVCARMSKSGRMNESGIETERVCEFLWFKRQILFKYKLIYKQSTEVSKSLFYFKNFSNYKTFF